MSLGSHGTHTEFGQYRDRGGTLHSMGGKTEKGAYQDRSIGPHVPAVYLGLISNTWETHSEEKAPNIQLNLKH